MQLPPRQGYTDEVRRLVEAFTARACGDPDRAVDVAMASAELLENAITYSTDASPVRVTVAVSSAKGRVGVAVRNNGAGPHIARLRQAYARLIAERDPLKHFGDLLLDPRRPGLGLGRIRNEGALEVKVSIRGVSVDIRASGPFVRRTTWDD